MVPDEKGQYSEFYEEYVQDIIKRVESNAKSEFEFLWDEHEKTGKRNTQLSRELSEAINDLSDVISSSKLFENENIKRHVLEEFFPACLLDKVGYETLLDRIPEPFLKSAFSKHLARMYYYNKGAKKNTNAFEFYNFVRTYDKK